MRRILFIGAVCVGASMATASADPTDLGWGVLVSHYVPDLVFSSDPPAEGWCEAYWQFGLHSCRNQTNRVDVGGYLGCCWFVLAAWSSEKEWCEAEFGLGHYDARVFSFVDWGPCYPSVGIEVPTSGWPAPNEGTAFLSTGEPWTGNLLPVYYFGGYAYSDFGPEIIPLGVNPATGLAGTANCLQPHGFWEADQLGGLGINSDGIFVCPTAVCCDTVTNECHIMNQADCEEMGGLWDPRGHDCPLACEEHVCCFFGECFLMSYPECWLMGGDWDGYLDSCGPPNPCGGPSAEQRTSWGKIKSLYYR